MTTDTRWVQVPADWLRTQGQFTFLTDNPRHPVTGPVLDVREAPPAPAAPGQAEATLAQVRRRVERWRNADITSRVLRELVDDLLAVLDAQPGQPEQGDSERRDFPIGDVLSVTTGRLVSARGIDAVYELLSWLAGRPVFTHELERFAALYTPLLSAQHRWLADVPEPRGLTGKGDALAWVAEQAARHGATLTITAPRRPGTEPAR